MIKPYGYVRADGKGLFIYGDHQFTNNQNHDLIPVYTHPKEWVGLTDEERIDILVDAVRTKWDDQEIIKAIEAKLKEKNGA
jgi:hypothetical protein